MNTPRDMFQFTATALSEQQPEELNLRKDDSLAKHLNKRSDFSAATTHMTFKWNKPPAGDGSDSRRGTFVTSGSSGGVSVGSVGSIGIAKNEFLGIQNNQSKQSWRSLGKAILDSKTSLHHKRISPTQLQQQHGNDDDSGDETDNTTSSSQAPSQYKRSLNSESQHSKLTANSFDINDSMPSYYNLHKKKSSSFIDGDATREHSIHSNDSALKTAPNANAWPITSKMNFIMLLGLVIGLVISKTLQYLQLYFSWFQTQVLQLRLALLGTVSIFDFFNFEDTSRFGLRTKLLLLPVVATFSLLYGTIVFLHHIIQFLLTQAPSSLVNFIQKLYVDI